MAKKLDGVIEAVRYTPDGKIDMVRAYERRGAIYSDYLLIRRAALVEKLKAGKRFTTGTRREFLASTFDVTAEIRYDSARDVISADPGAERDSLPAPRF